MNVVEKLEEIIPEITKRFDAIEVFYLFGSFASGSASDNSDVDVAFFIKDSVYIKNPLVDLEVGVALERELGCDVDVVVMNRVTSIMQHEILRTGKRLFERSAQRRSFFELKSFKEYSDAKYYQRRRFNG